MAHGCDTSRAVAHCAQGRLRDQKLEDDVPSSSKIAAKWTARAAARAPSIKELSS
jgi:hypothetical protein